MKSDLDDLAIFGGKPVFTDSLVVGRPNIGDRDKIHSRLDEILHRNWLTNSGPFEKEFEQQVAKIAGVKHCIAACNGTIALELAIRALDMNGEVVVPSFTFVATAHALKWQEITPVFCDIDPETYTIDPGKLEELLTPRTTGIIGVHLWGRSCDIATITEIARKNDLSLLFDASHAFGCSYKGQMVGSFGDAEVFSFHATKFVNCFEGGAIVTNNDDLANKLRLMRNFGFVGNDSVGLIGTNGKMTEVSAAMGLTSLESMQEFLSANRINYDQYRKQFRSVPGVRLLTFDTNESCNYQYVVIELDRRTTGLSRDNLMAVLKADGVRARRYFYPGCHNMEPYRTLSPDAGLSLGATEKLMKKVLCLPTGISVDTQIVEKVCDLIGFAVMHGPEIQTRLTAC